VSNRGNSYRYGTITFVSDKKDNTVEMMPFNIFSGNDGRTDTRLKGLRLHSDAESCRS
jgi:hypothetical protein